MLLLADRFIVLSYNILADYLAQNHRSKLYYHIPRYMLDWEWRKKNMLFELELWSADIMCFQVCHSFFPIYIKKIFYIYFYENIGFIRSFLIK